MEKIDIDFHTWLNNRFWRDYSILVQLFIQLGLRSWKIIDWFIEPGCWVIVNCVLNICWVLYCKPKVKVENIDWIDLQLFEWNWHFEIHWLLSTVTSVSWSQRIRELNKHYCYRQNNFYRHWVGALMLYWTLDFDILWLSDRLKWSWVLVFLNLKHWKIAWKRLAPE